MRKSFLFIVLLLPALASAITQQGFVRTISRPNYTPQRLDGVLIRIRGNHNPVLSTETGDFAILLHDLQNGDPYALSAVMKSGYQLSEQDLIGRQQAGSERVPLELTMVSTAQLQAEKNAIAAKAREGVEHYYLEQLTAIESALAEQRLTAEQYEQQIAALDDKLMRSEEQIMAMADRYARTDYALLDSVAGAIQTAIEGGDIDALTEELWSSLNEDNRVSLYVRFVNLETFEVTGSFELGALSLIFFVKFAAFFVTENSRFLGHTTCFLSQTAFRRVLAI